MTVRRGTSNSNSRGSSYARRKRKQAVLDLWGTGEWTVCITCPTVLDFETLTLDRIHPGVDGGKYEIDNLRPQCMPCASRQGGLLSAQRNRERKARERS